VGDEQAVAPAMEAHHGAPVSGDKPHAVRGRGPTGWRGGERLAAVALGPHSIAADGAPTTEVEAAERLTIGFEGPGAGSLSRPQRDTGFIVCAKGRAGYERRSHRHCYRFHGFTP